MAKTVFRPQETVPLSSAYVLHAPGGDIVVEDVEAVAPALEYEGPTADDLRAEAELFSQNWEREKEAMMAAARAEARTSWPRPRRPPSRRSGARTTRP
ncbi:MAG TPA: hypothetical protein PLE25_05450 [Spirochaetales bacterium]|nr:hypothetical protein [Spirochaetales bacterium]